MSQTSVYKIQVNTDSADSNALLLLAGGVLVAILVELADESHGEACGQWTVETTFGLNLGRRPEPFESATEAADWVSQRICRHAFLLDGQIVELV